MKTQSAKAKGRRLQQLVVKKVLEKFPELTARDVQSRAMGSQGTDVVLSEKAVGVFPYAVECKNQEANKKLFDMFRQTSDNTVLGKERPLLVVSANHQPVLAVLLLEDFMELV